MPAIHSSGSNIASVEDVNKRLQAIDRPGWISGETDRCQTNQKCPTSDGEPDSLSYVVRMMPLGSAEKGDMRPARTGWLYSARQWRMGGKWLLAHADVAQIAQRFRGRKLRFDTRLGFANKPGSCSCCRLTTGHEGMTV